MLDNGEAGVGDTDIMQAYALSNGEAGVGNADISWTHTQASQGLDSHGESGFCIGCVSVRMDSVIGLVAMDNSGIQYHFPHRLSEWCVGSGE